MKLYEIYEGEKAYYLVLELLEGPPLNRFVREAAEGIPETAVRGAMKVV